jgi:long-chain acyl-CoA synthetase
VTVPLYDYYGFIQIYGHILGQCGFIFGDSLGLPDQFLRRFREERFTDLVLVPHTLREMLRMPGFDRRNIFQSLQVITSSSDTLSTDLLDDVFSLNPGLKIFNIYGLTEAGRACFKEITHSSIIPGSIGRPSDGVEIEIEGPKGKPGEIIIRGPNVMLGYLQDIHNDRVIFSPYSEMRTGDLAYYDAKGDIILLGRRDHLLNIRGSKMHPAEIEAIALQVGGVVDAFAYSRMESSGESSVCLDVVVKEDVLLSSLQGYLRRNLPSLFFPREIKIVPHIKRTELGSKILRSKDFV